MDKDKIRERAREWLAALPGNENAADVLTEFAVAILAEDELERNRAKREQEHAIFSSARSGMKF